MSSCSTSLVKVQVELAFENGQAEVAKFISEYKADENTRNNKSHSTTPVKVEHGTDDDGENNAKDSESLLAAAEEGNIDTLRSLLEQGADINTCNACSQTPLHRAAAKGNVDIVRWPLGRGVEVDSQGWTPLHVASRFGHLEVSRVLLDHGANVNARKQNYWTPMHLSTANGCLEIVKLLLERGADIHAMNAGGETPFQVSLRTGNREIANLLRVWKNRAERLGELS